MRFTEFSMTEGIRNAAIQNIIWKNNQNIDFNKPVFSYYITDIATETTTLLIKKNTPFRDLEYYQNNLELSSKLGQAFFNDQNQFDQLIFQIKLTFNGQIKIINQG
jgi:hypothetical protein